MAYKKAPSIREFDKKVEFLVWQKRRDKQIEDFLNSMSPEQRKQWDETLLKLNKQNINK